MSNVVDKDAVPSLDYLKNPFAKPAYDARIKSTQYEYFHTQTGTKGTNCLRFCIPRTSGNRVANIDKFILAMDMKMTNKAKNGRPPPDIKAAPCNNFLNSVIGALSVSYNNTVVCKIDRYPIFNYTKKMLTCDDNDFKTWAETQCFYPEAEDEDLDNVNTEGWKKRMTQFGGPITKPAKIQDPTVDPSTEKLIDNPDLGKFQYGDEPSYWIGRLDTFLDTPALLPNVDIHIQLDLSKPEYVFQSLDDKNTDINYSIERARLFVPFMKHNDSLYTQLKNRLDKEPMRQFYTSTQITTHSISTGDKSTVFSSLCPGVYPNRVYVLIQEVDRLEGSYTMNSLKFSRGFNLINDPFMLQTVSMKHNGVEVEGLASDDNQKSFRDQYFRLLELTNQNHGKSSCSISFSNFVNNHCFLLYDFTSSLNMTEPPLLPLVEPGNLRLELTFDKPTTCPLNVIIMAELSTSLTLDGQGKCTVSTM